MTVIRTMRTGRPKKQAKAIRRDLHIGKTKWHVFECSNCGHPHYTKNKPIRCSNRATCGRMFE